VLNDKLDMPGVVAVIDSYLKELERDYPILNYYIVRSRMGSGDLTGRAVETMFHDVIREVEESRVPYDSALVRIQKMAMSIGGFRGYKGYENFDLQEAFESGRLDHSIGRRKLAPEDDMDKLNYAAQVAKLGTELINLANPVVPVVQDPTKPLQTGGETQPQDPISTSELATIVQTFIAQIKSGTMTTVRT
jgi:hypothetical protein